MRVPWNRLELNATRHAKSTLETSIEVLSRGLSATEAVLRLKRTRGLSEVSQVRVALLSQLAVTCRTVLLLAQRGYPLQAMVLLSSVYELATSLAYAGRDGARASQWLSHDLDRESFPSTKHRKAAIKELLLAGGFAELTVAAAVSTWESRYTAYCMAKHGNPKVLRHYGIRRDSRSFFVAVGPLSGGPYTRLAKLVLLRASQLLVMATLVHGKRETEEEGAELSSNAVRGLSEFARDVARLQAAFGGTDLA